MKKRVMIEEQDLVHNMEQVIAKYIVENIDEGHFDNFADEESASFNIRRYDKNYINSNLKNMKTKKAKEVYAAGYAFYLTVTGLDIKIDQNLFYFVAFMKDLHLKNKRLKDN